MRMGGFRGLCLVLQAAVLMALPSPKLKWLEGRSRHFQVVSAVSERETRQVMTDLERFRASLALLLGEGEAAGRALELPSRVFLFPNESQYQEYASTPHTIGVFFMNPFGFNILLRMDGEEVRPLLYHEYFHHHLRRIAPGLEVPVWTNEGLACFYETTAIKSGQVTFGMPTRGWLRVLLHQKRMPIPQLIQVTHSSPEYQEELLRHQFYASSWITTHYLLLGNPSRRRQLPEYLGRLRARQPHAQAFVAAFGCTPEALDQEVDAYFRGIKVSIPVQHAPLSSLVFDASQEVSPLPREKALACLGQALTGRMSGSGTAREHFLESLRIDENCVEAQVGLGVLEHFQQNGARGQSWFKKLPDDLRDPMHAYLRATFERSGLGYQEGLKRQLKDFTCAAKGGVGDETRLRALAYPLGQVALDDVDRRQLEDLATAAPSVPELQVALARQLWMTGQLEEAERRFTALFAHPEAGAAAKEAFEFLQSERERRLRTEADSEANLCIMQAMNLMNEKDFKGAKALLEKGLALPIDESRREALQRLIQHVEAGERQASNPPRKAPPKKSARRR